MRKLKVKKAKARERKRMSAPYIIEPVRSHWINKFEPFDVWTDQYPDGGCMFCFTPEGVLQEFPVYNSKYMYFSCQNEECMHRAFELTQSINRKIVRGAYKALINARVRDGEDRKDRLVVKYREQKYEIATREDIHLFEMMDKFNILKEDFGDMRDEAERKRNQVKENQQLFQQLTMSDERIPMLPSELWAIISDINKKQIDAMDTPEYALLDNVDITVEYDDNYDCYDAHTVTEDDFKVVVYARNISDNSPVNISLRDEYFEDKMTIGWIYTEQIW